MMGRKHLPDIPERKSCMFAEERRHRILEILARDGRVIAKDLSRLFDMSVDSIRRDLTILANRGLLRKTYGGAVAANNPAVQARAIPESVRSGGSPPHRRAIARMAASFVQARDTIFIGGSDIHFEMLDCLPKDIPFQIITNSIRMADVLRKLKHVETYLIGGKLRADSAGSMIDPLAVEMIGKFAIDIGFLTGGGIDAGGVSTAAPDEAAFAKGVARASRRKIYLAPHEQVGHRMFVVSVPIGEIDMVITDQAASSAAIRELEQRQVQVLIADEHRSESFHENDSSRNDRAVERQHRHSGFEEQFARFDRGGLYGG
jgi:DeoR/GlpR family transcriptional regulator of sugar metabolism